MSSWQREGFIDRMDAAEQLADTLKELRGKNPLVLAIPRGGVPIGRVLADRLEGELDVVLVRKIGAPGHSEYAIGAIDEQGIMQLSADAALTGADDRYVKKEAAAQLATIRARRQLYSPYHAAISPAGRTVVVVDDGLATGATMRAALQAVRAQKPERLICAVPVAAQGGLAEIADMADDLVYLAAPAHFRAVSLFYREFSAVEDDEVVRLLQALPHTTPASAADTSAQAVRIPADGVLLDGELQVPPVAKGLVIFAHGSGSHRMSPRNRYVAEVLHAQGLATLLFDLLSEDEARDPAERFNITRLAARMHAARRWSAALPALRALPVGLFGASTGAAAALVLAARHPDMVNAVVSRGGRPDLAGQPMLAHVHAPTLLIVGGADTQVIPLNRSALGALAGPAEMVLVPGATHLFEEPGALKQVALLAAGWFRRWLFAEDGRKGDEVALH